MQRFTPRRAWAAMLCVGLCFLVAAHCVNAHRVVAVGDIHGDLEQFLAVLQMADVVDKNGDWTCKLGTVVVQLGDMLDRGPHDKAVMDYMMKLTAQAAASGGRVVNLLGNHELMNLQSQFHYVHPESNEDFGGKHLRKRNFRVDSEPYGVWLRSLPVVHVEGTSVFVHAGLAAPYAEMGVDEINKQARELLLRDSKIPHDDFLFGIHGPIWTRMQITDAMNHRCDGVEAALRALNKNRTTGALIERIVVGHTPQRSGRVESYCNDQLIAVDVGLSKWMYGNLAALEITELDDIENKGHAVLHEIIPNTKSVQAKDDEEEGSAPKSDVIDDDDDSLTPINNKRKSSGKSDDEVAQAVNDPMLLQELLEVLQEAQRKEEASKSHPADENRIRDEL